MKTLRFDSVGGASGDMILGALIDLGVDADRIRSALATLPIDVFELIVEPCSSHGLNGTRVTVKVPREHHHHHRHLSDIKAIIEDSTLSQRVKEWGVSAFKRIAVAEATIHNSTPEKIHFHEVGAMDSIVDIVGCCVALDLLGVENVIAGPLPMGQGTITCEHGVYPIPAPATVELLSGMTVTQTDEPFELVTPTGAALIALWHGMGEEAAKLQVERTGYGFGHHALHGRPNVLRATLMREVVSSGQDACTVLECNIDDMTPELVGAMVDRLMDEGALDVFTTPVQMKKQRPGFLITILTKNDAKAKLLDLVFQESTTFGVRAYDTKRTVLDRNIVEVETEYGKVRMKIGSRNGQIVTRSPEMDDCVRLAQNLQVPVRKIYNAAQAALHESSIHTSFLSERGKK